MSFRDGRAFWRLDRPSWGHAFEPSIQEASEGYGSVIPETAAVRSTEYQLPDVELPRSRPWLLTANGMLGSQLNNVGYRHSYVEGNLGDAMRGGLFIRSEAASDYAAEHATPTGVTASAIPRRGNLMFARHQAAPWPAPRDGSLFPRPSYE